MSRPEEMLTCAVKEAPLECISCFTYHHPISFGMRHLWLRVYGGTGVRVQKSCPRDSAQGAESVSFYSTP